MSAVTASPVEDANVGSRFTVGLTTAPDGSDYTRGKYSLLVAEHTYSFIGDDQAEHHRTQIAKSGSSISMQVVGSSIHFVQDGQIIRQAPYDRASLYAYIRPYDQDVAITNISMVQTEAEYAFASTDGYPDG